jgi:uncharacterized secreted protein with C-terminal beta-propeller domain
MQSSKNSQFRISRLLILATIVILPASAANLSGSITYKTTGQLLPLAQAQVAVYNTETRAKDVTLSDDNGAYIITRLAAGTYIIIVEKNGRRLYQGRVDVHEPTTQFDIPL